VDLNPGTPLSFSLVVDLDGPVFSLAVLVPVALLVLVGSSFGMALSPMNWSIVQSSHCFIRYSASSFCEPIVVSAESDPTEPLVFALVFVGFSIGIALSPMMRSSLQFSHCSLGVSAFPYCDWEARASTVPQGRVTLHCTLAFIPPCGDVK